MSSVPGYMFHDINQQCGSKATFLKLTLCKGVFAASSDAVITAGILKCGNQCNIIQMLLINFFKSCKKML